MAEKWKKAKLALEGNELLYEEWAATNERGNPIDVVPLVTVHDRETCTGRKFPAEAVAKELCLRWNEFLQLRDALEAMMKWQRGIRELLPDELFEQVRVALNRSKGP